MNKNFILGLDGLEYGFVEKWNLVHLKQRTYGRIEVPVNEERGVPSTPEVWASFLTGSRIYMDGFESVNPNPPLSLILNLLKFMRKYLNLSLGLAEKIRENILPKWWISTFPPLKQKTFLDFINSKEINAPFYSYDSTALIVAHHFGDGNLSLRQTIDVLEALYEQRKKQILHETAGSQKFQVTFAYMHFPDVLQHFLFTKSSYRIRKLYLDLDDYVSQLKKEVGDSTFIIVSDHGFSLELGNHSKYGFYSSNMTIDPKPRRITDFFTFLEKYQR